MKTLDVSERREVHFILAELELQSQGRKEAYHTFALLFMLSLLVLMDPI